MLCVCGGVNLDFIFVLYLQMFLVWHVWALVIHFSSNVLEVSLQRYCTIDRWYQLEANSVGIHWSHVEWSRDSGLSLAWYTDSGKYLLTVEEVWPEWENYSNLKKSLPKSTMSHEEKRDLWLSVMRNTGQHFLTLGCTDAWDLILLVYTLLLSALHFLIL